METRRGCDVDSPRRRGAAATWIVRGDGAQRREIRCLRYSSVVQPFATAQAAKIGWIDAVCSLEKERERNLYDCDDFVINVDTKWTTHGPFDADKTTWPAAPWTRDLYLLAISKDAKLASLRDLRGPEGARFRAARIFRGKVAAPPRLRRGYFVGDGSRRRRGREVDIPRGRGAAAVASC